MAKTNKSGLGRGLNTLFGSPDPVSPQKLVDNKVGNPSYEENTEEAPSPNTEQETKIVSRETTSDVAKSRVVTDESLVEEFKDDKIEIKGIVTREAKSPVNDSQSFDGGKTSEEPLGIEKDLGEVDIEAISPNPDQPRINFKKDELEELSYSIARDGLLQPILVRTIGVGKYQIIAGERRWQASKLAGLKTVPIRIRDVEPDKALELALIENIQRSDLNPIEEAYAYRRMIERNNMTQSEIAQAVSKGRSTIANALRLLELPEDAQQLLYEEKITAGHARAILSIPTKEGREKLTKKLLEEKISVREAESIARLFSGQASESSKQRAVLPASYKRVARSLRKELDVSVRIKSAKGKNKIEIEFEDENELQRLFERIIEKSSAE